MVESGTHMEGDAHLRLAARTHMHDQTLCGERFVTRIIRDDPAFKGLPAIGAQALEQIRFGLGGRRTGCQSQRRAQKREAKPDHSAASVGAPRCLTSFWTFLTARSRFRRDR